MKNCRGNQPLQWIRGERREALQHRWRCPKHRGIKPQIVNELDGMKRVTAFHHLIYFFPNSVPGDFLDESTLQLRQYKSVAVPHEDGLESPGSRLNPSVLGPARNRSGRRSGLF